MRITWFGHSTVLLELDGVRLLTDPMLRRRAGHLLRTGTVDLGALQDIDAVLVSHVHHDHLDLPSLRRLRPPKIIVPRGAGSLLRRLRFAEVVELGRGEDAQVASTRVTATYAEHNDKRGLFGPRAPALGYLISGSARIYFAGDTDLFDDMRSFEDLDVALLPVAGWGASVPKGHLDPARAAEALRRLRPHVGVPIHWGTYRHFGLGGRDLEGLRRPAEQFALLAAQVAPDVDVRILPQGGTLDLTSEAGLSRALP